MSAIRLSQTGSSSYLRTRHIARSFYFVMDRMDHREIAVSFVGTNDMVADIQTKLLQGAKFRELRAKLTGDCNSE